MYSRKQAAIKRHESKRQVIGSLSSLPPPTRYKIVRERPSNKFNRRKIEFEKIFPTDMILERDEWKWTLDFLTKNKKMHITMPATEEIYPRLVRLFYQHLKPGPWLEKKDDYFEFTVDGHYENITIEDIGKILGLPHAFDKSMKYLTPVLRFTYGLETYVGILGDFSVDESKGSGETIYVSALPERVWLLDQIYKKNLFPLGHHSEGRAKFLWALYSAHKGHFYSLSKIHYNKYGL